MSPDLPLKSHVHLPLRLRCDKPSEMKWWPPFTSEQTVLWHGIYLAAIALVFLFAPGLVRAFLQFPAELDWWNRVLALPVFNLGVLCIGSALAKSRLLIKLTAATARACTCSFCAKHGG